MPTPTKTLPQLAIPLVVSFTLRFLFTFVDLAYAAVLDDDADAVAAIGLYIPFQGFYIAIWVGLSAGFTAALSRAFGHRDAARVDALARAIRRILLLLIPALVAGGAALWAAVPAMGLDPGLASAFRVYGPMVLAGMSLTGMWSLIPDSIVKAHHDTKSTMVAGILASATNVALNTLFVFAFGWGIAGLALGTVLSRLPALGYALHRAARLEATRAVGWDRGARGDWPPPVRSILTLALPGGLTYALTALENSLVTAVLATLPAQKTALATFGVYHQILMLALMPTIACSVAVVPFVGRAVPEGRQGEVARDLRRTAAMAAAFALLLTLPAGWLFARPVADFFVAQRGAAELTDQALAALRVLPFAALGTVGFLLLRPVFEALHRPRLGVAVSVARFVVLSAPLVLAARWLAPHAGIEPLTGVVAGLATAALLASALTAWWVRAELAKA